MKQHFKRESVHPARAFAAPALLALGLLLACLNALPAHAGTLSSGSLSVM
ncbi:hypothetical protein [Sandaracinobacter neustonicus]|nr:hypothetical protein [Sandaracinobacter neustonicus]